MTQHSDKDAIFLKQLDAEAVKLQKTIAKNMQALGVIKSHLKSNRKLAAIYRDIYKVEKLTPA